MDPKSVSTEPLSMLLPSRRDRFVFTLAGYSPESFRRRFAYWNLGRVARPVSSVCGSSS